MNVWPSVRGWRFTRVTRSWPTDLQHVVMEDDAIECEDVRALLTGVWDANRKLDSILRYLYDEDDGEEEETDPDA
jgi:hypothetical protein